jgi:hypothetical protein
MSGLPSRESLQPGQHVSLRNDPSGAVGVIVRVSTPSPTWVLVRWEDADGTVEASEALIRLPAPSR